MSETGQGCVGLGVVGIIILVILAIVGMAVMNAAGNFADAQAEKAQAEARLELARAEHDRVRGDVWQEKFMLWTTALKSFSSDGQVTIVLLAGALGAAVAIGITRWLARLGL